MPNFLYDLNGSIAASQSSSEWRHSIHNPHQLYVRGRIDSCDGLTGEVTDAAVLGHVAARRSFQGISGQFTAFYTDGADAIAFRAQFSPHHLYFHKTLISSDLGALARRLPKTPKFSESYFLRFAAQMRALQFSSELTPLQDVHRLLPAQELFFKNGVVEHKRDCNLHVYSICDDPAQTTDDVSKQIADLLTRIVGEQLQQSTNRPVFCELSGGLDSSYVTSLVASLGAKPKCYMYTFSEYESHTFSERCAENVAERYGLDLTKASMSDFAMPNFAAPIEVGSEPADLMWQGALFSSFVKKFVGPNAVILSGFGADQIFIRQNEIVVWLLQRCKFRTAFKVIASLAKDLDRSTAHFMWQAFLASLPRKWYLRLSRPFRKLFFNPFKVEEIDSSLYFYERLNWLKTGSKPYETWLYDIQKEASVLDARSFAVGHIHPDQSYHAAPDRVVGPFYDPHQISYVHPFCDSRLIDYVYRNVSWHLIHDWTKPYKYLLREAQKGVLPEFVRTRKNNEFSTDGFFHKVLMSNKSALRQVLVELCDEFPNSLDKDAVMKDFERLMFGVADLSVQRLLRLTSYALWMKNFRSISVSRV